MSHMGMQYGRLTRSQPPDYRRGSFRPVELGSRSLSGTQVPVLRGLRFYGDWRHGQLQIRPPQIQWRLDLSFSGRRSITRVVGSVWPALPQRLQDDQEVAGAPF